MEFMAEQDAAAYPTPYDDLIRATYSNIEIQSAFVKHYSKFAKGEYEKIVVSVSGGADSDRLVDFIEHIGYPQGSLEYVFFDTGMEFRATKQHLSDLEKRYGIRIRRLHARMTVAIACKKYIPVPIKAGEQLHTAPTETQLQMGRPPV